MKNKIIEVSQIKTEVAKLGKNKRIVLLGGCFDIFHIGHLHFLKKVKLKDRAVVVLLEADETVKKLKGNNRPLHTQNERAEILAALSLVDIVIKLPIMRTNKMYEQLVKSIKPGIIAVSANDPIKVVKQQQAEEVGAQLIEIERINNRSTSRITKQLLNEL